MKKAIFLFCLLAAGWLSGCAETATPVTSFGNQMVVEVTLRGPIDVNNNRYFLVLSDNPSFKIPLPPPENVTYEFIEPGMTPLQGAVADYYLYYYSTWSGYIVLDPSGYSLVKGPFLQGQTTTRETVSGLGEVSSKIRFVFLLDRIFGPVLPATVYFDFVSVSWPTSYAKFARDHLTSTNAYISSIAGSTQTIPDENNSAIDASLDILNCVVTIQ